MTVGAAAVRPKVHVNCAVSIDGRLAYAGGRRALLSGPHDLVRVQELRAACDAILVGVGTVLADDPSLRVHWDLLGRPPVREPLRVLLDSQGRIPDEAKVLDGSQPTLVATSARCSRIFPKHVQVFRGGGDRVDLPGLLAELHRREVRSLFVEGGSKVLASFLSGGLVDDLTVYVAPVVIGGTSAPTMVGGPDLSDAVSLLRLRRTSVAALDDGVLLSFAPDSA